MLFSYFFFFFFFYKVNNVKNTALIRAGLRGQLHVVQWLLENAHVPFTTNELGDDVLMLGTFNNILPT